MTETTWTAEQTRNGWGLRYNPTPGGKLNADGTRSFSLSFIAIELTDMVGEPETAARDLARELNAFPSVVQALTKADTFLDHLKASFTQGVCGHTQAMVDEIKAALAKSLNTSSEKDA